MENHKLSATMLEFLEERRKTCFGFHRHLFEDFNARDSEGATILHLVLWMEEFDIAKELISLGVELNSADSLGYTPLHVAVSQQSLVIVKLLVKAGANLNARNEFNKTPLEHASSEGNEEIANFLHDYITKNKASGD
jgi:ankyrin repeat protein